MAAQEFEKLIEEVRRQDADIARNFPQASFLDGTVREHVGEEIAIKIEGR